MALVKSVERITDIGSIVAQVAADPFRFGNEPGRGPWRIIKYHVWQEMMTVEGVMTMVGANQRASNFSDALMGITTIAGMDAFSLANRIQAHRYPGNQRLICLSVDGGSVGAVRPAQDDATGKLVEAEICEVNAFYGVPAFPMDNLIDDPGGIASFPGGPYPYAEIGLSTSTTEESIDPASLKDKVDAANHPITRAVRRQVARRVYRMRFRYLPFVGLSMLKSLGGKVNGDIFMDEDPGTLLFSNGETENEISPRGDRMFALNVQLTHEPFGWNTDTQPGESGPREIVLLDGSPLHEPADFSIVTKLAQP